SLYQSAGVKARFCALSGVATSSSASTAMMFLRIVLSWCGGAVILFQCGKQPGVDATETAVRHDDDHITLCCAVAEVRNDAIDLGDVGRGAPVRAQCRNDLVRVERSLLRIALGMEQAGQDDLVRKRERACVRLLELA